MSKILIIGKYYYPFVGGIEANTRSVAEHLARSHEVTALVNAHTAGASEDVIANVRVMRKKVDINFGSQPISLGFLDGDLLRNADVIHFHAPNPYAAFLLWTWGRFNKLPPVVITHHMDIYGRKLLRLLTKPFCDWLFRQSKAVVVTSIKNANISADLPQNLNIQVVPLGLPAEEYEMTPEFKAAAQAWKIEKFGHVKTVGFLGRHARYKGLTELIKAIEAIPDLHGLIAGDGPYRSSAEALAKSLGLSDRIHFLGRIDQETKLKLLSSIDVFAFPSSEITEAFGVSQMEAMLCGAPVVAANLPTGVTDVAIDGQTALVFEPGNVEGLVQKLLIMLNDRELALRLAQQGQANVRENMNEHKIASQTAAILEKYIA